MQRRGLQLRWVLAMVGVMAVMLAAAPLAADEDAKLERLGERYLDEGLRLQPLTATALGDHRFDDQIGEVSAESRAERARFARDLLRRLDRLDREKLSHAGQVDAALLRHELESELFELEELQEWRWNPVIYSGLSGGAVYNLMAREFAPLADRLGHVAARLEKLPRFLAQVRATLVPAAVPPIHAQTAARQNAGLLSILDEMVAPQLDVLEPTAGERLEAAMEIARRAVGEHQKWLDEVLVPQAKGDFRIGAELFERKLGFTLNSPLSRADVLSRAETEYERVREEMYQVSQTVYSRLYPHTHFPDQPSEAYRQAITRAALEEAYRQRPAPGELVETAKETLRQATDFVRQRELISLPDAAVDVVLMPEFQRGVSVAYCDSPGPLDAGQKTYYAVAPLPEDWSPEQVDSFLREYNTYSIHELSIHEAMPGHYVQIAHSNEYPSTLRAVLSSGPFVEGWAVYAERVMSDAGYLDADPLMRLIMLKWYLRSVTNAIIDQKIHVDGMSREEAMALMVEGGFQEESEAAGKWVRAQLTSTQLSTYFVGYQEHADLRRAAEARAGDAFDLKAYHDRALSFGSPPVRFVRALVLGEEIPR